MKMYKKMFAFLLVLTLVLSGFNINAESVLAGEDTEAVLENLSTGVKTITANPTSELKERQRTFKLEGKNLV